MKKLIAISVMLALVAGAAFAETTVFGSVEAMWMILQINDFDNMIAETGPNKTLGGANGMIAAGVLGIRGADEDGIVSGMLVTSWKGWDLGVANSGVWINRAFIIWKPLEMVELFIGADGDGKWTNGNNIRWAYHKMGRGVATEGWWGHDYIIGHWDGTGVAASVKPTDMITLNVALEMCGRENVFVGNIGRWEDLWDQGLHVGVDVALPVGKVNLTYRAIGTWPDSGKKRIGLSYGGAPVDGIELDIGGNYRLEDADGNDVRDMLAIGLGLYYNGDGWGVKTRTFIEICQQTEDMKAAGTDAIHNWMIDIMPWYGFEFAEVRCNIRLDKGIRTSGVELDNMTWHLNPHIVKQIGPAQLKAGIMVGNCNDSRGGTPTNEDGKPEPAVGLKIPLAFVMDF